MLALLIALLIAMDSVVTGSISDKGMGKRRDQKTIAFERRNVF